jgi:hypothetical protein
MCLQAAVHLGRMPWALTKEEEEDFYQTTIFPSLSTFSTTQLLQPSC